jgi:hypothetical protein
MSSALSDQVEIAAIGALADQRHEVARTRPAAAATSLVLGVVRCNVLEAVCEQGLAALQQTLADARAEAGQLDQGDGHQRRDHVGGPGQVLPKLPVGRRTGVPSRDGCSAAPRNARTRLLAGVDERPQQRVGPSQVRQRARPHVVATAIDQPK